jgi:PAS domain S-box-containing protein
MNVENIEILKKALDRERKSRKAAEKILEQKSRNLLLISKELKLTNLKLQKLLDEKSTQLEGIFENINDAYVVLDLSGNILKMNNIAEKIFEHDSTNVRTSLFSLVHKEDANHAKDSFKTLIEKGSITNFTCKIFINKNNIKWVEVNASLVYSNTKRPIAAQGIVRDITNIVELQHQKEKILKKLKESNTHLEEYAHIVSHDLKSPLRNIEALVSWIKSDNYNKFDETTQKNFELIENTLETMDNLIFNILEYSSASSEAKEHKDVDLNVLLLEIKNTLNLPKHISLNILTKLPTIKGDKTKFRQVFQNLISNSLKFNDKKEGFIYINFKENEKYYEFSVEDNGIGIQDKYKDKVFEIFQSLHKNKESSGVGLSIVKKIIKLYEGDIWFESIPNIGTKFIFTLKK